MERRLRGNRLGVVPKRLNERQLEDSESKHAIKLGKIIESLSRRGEAERAAVFLTKLPRPPPLLPEDVKVDRN